MPRASFSSAKRQQGTGSHLQHHHLPAAASSSSSISCASSATSPTNSPPTSLPTVHGQRRNTHGSRSHKTNGHANASVAAASVSVSASNHRDAASSNGRPASSAGAPPSHHHANGLAARHHLHQNHHHQHIAVGEPRRDSVGSSSASSASAVESFTSQSSIHISDDSHRRIDITTMKNPEIHRDPGPLGLALTVIRSCPAADTIAILVLLMQLSPFFLSLVYILFTFLTFVPPATSSNFNSLSVTTVKEILQESSFNLSYLTAIALDLFIILVWLFLWDSAQNVILDLAKMVIALSLGAGSTSKGGGWKGFCGCLAVIAFSHFSKHSRLKTWLKRTFRVGWWWYAASLPSGADYPDDPLRHAPNNNLAAGSAWASAARWAMNVLALHIMTQGIMRYIRDWLLRNQKRENQHPSVSDPEAGKMRNFSDLPSTEAGYAMSDVVHSSTVSAAATTATTTTATNVAGAPSAVAPAADAQMATSTAVSARQKRKQGTQVRLRQPLWSAIASTRVVTTKERELTQVNSPGGSLTEFSGMVSAPFHSQEGQIWVSDIGSEEAFFATSRFPDHPPLDSPVVDAQHPDSSSLIDSTKPFYIRVNNAVWPSTQMYAMEEPVGPGGGEGEGTSDVQDQEEPRDKGTRWTGRIPGLPPSSNFVCEFVSTRTGRVICSTSFRTGRAQTNEVDVAASPAQTSRTRRPESPATTLKSSIKNVAIKTADERARFKSIKKENQAKYKSHKKELERLASSIQSSGSNDAKYRQKIQSNIHQKQQYEELAAEYEAELSNLRAPTKAVEKKRKVVEVGFKEEQEIFSRAQKENKNTKKKLQEELNTLQADNASLQNKRNKVATRIAKVDADLGRLSDTNAQGLGEAERRRKEQNSWEAEQARVEHVMRDRLQQQRDKIDTLEQQIQSIVSMAGQYYAQSQAQAQIAAAAAAASFSLEEVDEDGYDHDEFYAPSAQLNPAAPQYNPAIWNMNPHAQGFNPSPWPTSTVGGGALAQPVRGMCVPPGLVPPQHQTRSTRARSRSMLSDVSASGLSHVSDGELSDVTTVPIPVSVAMSVTSAPVKKAISPPPGFGPPGLSVREGTPRFPPGLPMLGRSDTGGSRGSGGGGSP